MKSLQVYRLTLVGLLGVSLLFFNVACSPPANNNNTNNNNNNNTTATGCTQDTDCGATETCTNTKCVPKATTPDCTKDAGCKSGQECKSGKCVDVGTPPCTKNEDCANGQKCDSGKCVPIGTPPCTKDTDCAAAEECKEGKCVTKPSDVCTSDADCPGGQTCDTTTGKCGGKPPVEPGTECDQANPCGTGLQCITGGGGWTKSYCFQSCANGGSCRAGTVCIQASATISICAKQGKAGDDCDFGGKDQTICAISQTAPEYCSPRTKKCIAFKSQKNEGDSCGDNTKDPIEICDSASALACVEKKCVKLKDSEEYGPCGGATGFQCKQGGTLQCIGTSTNSGHCFNTCDTSSPKCAAGQNCQALQQGSTNGACLPTGSLDYGQECGVGPTDKYDPAKLCGTDLSCVNFGLSICIELSQGNCQSYQCKTAGATCVDLNAGTNTFAGCFKPCTADTDCKFSTFCRDLGQAGKVCWPKSPPGDVPYGETCKSTNPTQATRCKEPNICVGTDAEGGFCGKSCTTDADCAAYTGGGKNIKASCVAAGSGKLCVFPCTTAGDTTSCPNTLECTSIGGSLICAPKPPSGPNDFMGTCNSQKPIATDGCKAGFNCIATSQAGDGFCTKSCSSNTDCGKAGTIQSTCVKGLTSDPNAGLCVVGCGQPGQTCPTGLQCRTFGQNSICAP